MRKGVRERVGEVRLGQRPRHRGRGADDRELRRRAWPCRRALDRPASNRTTGKYQTGQDRVGDADRGNFGRGGDAVHNRDADQHRQQQSWHATTNVRPISPHRRDAAIDICTLRHPPAGDDRERQREDHAGKDTAGEQSGDRYACHRANDDEHDGRGYRLGHRAGRREKRNEFALMNAALLHVGKQHRRDGGHVGGLRPRNAGDERRGAEQHVGKSTLDMANQLARLTSPSPCSVITMR